MYFDQESNAGYAPPCCVVDLDGITYVTLRILLNSYQLVLSENCDTCKRYVIGHHLALVKNFVIIFSGKEK